MLPGHYSQNPSLAILSEIAMLRQSTSDFVVSSVAFVITKCFVARLVYRVKTLRGALGRTTFPPFC